MLRRVVIGFLIRPLFSHRIKVGLENQIVKKGSTLCNCRCVVSAYRSVGKIGLHNQVCKFHVEKKIKFLRCEDMTSDNVGDHVELHGKISFTDNKKYTLSDGSGLIRLMLYKKDKEKWMNQLKPDSFVKLIGVVVQPPNLKSRSGSNEFPYAVLVKKIIPVSPLNEKLGLQTKDNLNLEVSPEELKRCSPSSMHYIFRRSHNCAALKAGVIGKNVTLCGWVRSEDGECTFTLEDGYGSILVNYAEEVENLTSRGESVHVNDLIFVEGVVSPISELLNHEGKNGHMVQVSAQKLKVIKDLNAESFGSYVPLEYNSKKPSSYKQDKNDESTMTGVEIKEKKNTSPDFNRYTLRTHNCGEIDQSLVGQTVRLMGWALYIRMKKFILLSDKYGSIQLIVPDSRKDLQKLLETLLPESIISVTGTVSSRPRGLENKFMKSGVLEVVVEDMQVVNRTESLPIQSKSKKPSKNVQLQYRYLDLRYNLAVKESLKMRCDVLHRMRRFLVENVGFLEVETPTLFRRTPGGAQEFIVPTRYEGEFYSLVQSPQQFKQLLMVGGIDRYFQIARCYRDETGQRDRQPEFTQLDIEMSFCDREGVLNLIEDLIKYIWPHDAHHLVTPFPRLTFEEAMTTYGSDKPDTRFDYKISDLTKLFRSAGTAGSTEGIDMRSYLSLSDFAAHAFVVRNGMSIYPAINNAVLEKRQEADNFHLFAIRVTMIESIFPHLAKTFSEFVSREITKYIQFESGDIIVLGLGPKIDVLKALGDIRIATIEFSLDDVNMSQKDDFHFTWILDFPLFELADGRIKSVHHPFTQPHPDDAHMLCKEPLKVRSLHYDLVLNGSEIGGGSIRIHDAALQKEVLEHILQLDVSPLKHLLEALQSGAPIHGGFALGIDRFIAHLRGLSNINDVIAFPKLSSGRDAMSGAPCPISDEDKALYHICDNRVVP